jgi:RimJ/RimL family protein N-acetyltransferase
VTWKILPRVPDRYWPEIWSLVEQFSGGMIDDRSPKSEQEMTAFQEQSRKAGGLEYLIVDEEKEMLGAVWCEVPGDGIAIGHLVFVPKKLSSAEKVEATKQAVILMFIHGVRKICWPAYPDNAPFLHFLGKLGAVKEGYFREHVYRNGQLSDMEMWASFRNKQ